MQLASLFQNGAVLQRNTTIPIWGKTTADMLVTGTLNGETTYSRSSAAGDFTLYFPPQPAGGPHKIEIVCGGEKCILEDIFFGEVWLASGQSNMQYKLSEDQRNDNTDPGRELTRQQTKEFLESVDHSSVFRYFHVPLQATTCEESSCEGSWKNIDTHCSAVAAWFGLYLQKHLDIPIGLITSSWGGTIAEAWCSPSALHANPITRNLLQIYQDKHLSEKNFAAVSREEYSRHTLSLLRPDTTNEGLAMGLNKVDCDDSDWQTMTLPGSWITQHISGNGAVWIRKQLQLPESWVGQDLMFRTGGIDKQDISYFNGTEIGRTGEGASLSTYMLSREYPIPAKLNTSTNAVIAVRGYSCCYDGSFNGDWHLENCATGEKIDLSGSWKIKVELNLGKVSLRRSTDLYGFNNPNTPGILFDSMIRPLIPCAIAGTIWYQGESNAGTIKDSKEYYEILKYLINDWRYQFRNYDMPFLMVQLAGYGQQESYSAKTPWPYLRESQRTLCGDLPGTFMATAIDCGDATDIHPQDKQTVGYRLAMNALHNNYHLTEIVPNGPELLRARQEAPGTVRLDFAWSAGMHLDCEAEQSFYVSADGENFVPADHAAVDGNSVVVTQAELKEIKCVRYAWADYPVNTLYNGDGFPASPFSAEVK